MILRQRLQSMRCLEKQKDSIYAFETVTLNEKDFLTTRISYKFNLKGPKKSNIRNNINHAVRNNLIVEEYKYISHRNPHIEKEIHSAFDMPTEVITHLEPIEGHDEIHTSILKPQP